MNQRTAIVYVVMYDDSRYDGPAGDHTHIARFWRKADAEAFAKANTCYGRPTTADRDEVPAHIAERWSIR